MKRGHHRCEARAARLERRALRRRISRRVERVHITGDVIASKVATATRDRLRACGVHMREIQLEIQLELGLAASVTREAAP